MLAGLSCAGCGPRWASRARRPARPSGPSEWKIHRLENGQGRLQERDIIDLLRLYEVTDPDEIAELLALAREANTPGWWQHYGDVLPQWFRTYVDLESAAT
jgi:hypothetical protein